MFTVKLQTCPAGTTLPLAVGAPAGCTAHLVVSGRKGQPCPPAALPVLPVGTGLYDESGTEHLRITGHVWLPSRQGNQALFCPLATARTDLPVGTMALTAMKNGLSLARITLSDKGFNGLREDQSGPAIEELVKGALTLACAQGFLLPDEPDALRSLLTRLALDEGYDLIITTGGTGVGPRDTTPQATSRVLDYTLPGFSQAMMQVSLEKTPKAAISRAVCGVIGQSLVINLPGSRRAVIENLEAVLPALSHTLDKLHGDPSDCGSC